MPLYPAGEVGQVWARRSSLNSPWRSRISPPGPFSAASPRLFCADDEVGQVHQLCSSWRSSRRYPAALSKLLCAGGRFAQVLSLYSSPRSLSANIPSRHRICNLFCGPNVLQVRNHLLTTVLLLRCDYAILLEFLSTGRGNLHVNLISNRKDCEALVEKSQARQQPANAVEGLLYWARFVALERGRSWRSRFATGWSRKSRPSCQSSTLWAMTAWRRWATWPPVRVNTCRICMVEWKIPRCKSISVLARYIALVRSQIGPGWTLDLALAQGLAPLESFANNWGDINNYMINFS